MRAWLLQKKLAFIRFVRPGLHFHIKTRTKKEKEKYFLGGQHTLL